jgi:hypothetical protein
MFYDLEQKKYSTGTNTMKPDYCFVNEIVRNFNEKVEIDVLLIVQISQIFMAATVERRNLKSMFYVCL